MSWNILKVVAGSKITLKRMCINFCCHVTNYHKLNGLNNALYLTISVGQNSGQDIIGFSAQGLKGCSGSQRQSRYLSSWYPIRIGPRSNVELRTCYQTYSGYSQNLGAFDCRAKNPVFLLAFDKGVLTVTCWISRVIGSFQGWPSMTAFWYAQY